MGIRAGTAPGSSLTSQISQEPTYWTRTTVDSLWIEMHMNRRIFYYAYDTTEHSGGEIDTYNHVDILNECGFDAYALHTKPGYRHCWFENKTRVIDLSSFWKIY